MRENTHKPEGKIKTIMYLMYNSEGNFLGILTEELEHDALNDSPNYFFVEIPNSLYYNTIKNEWELPAENLKVF